MTSYYPVSPLYWKAAKDRKWVDETALLGLYLLTCRHRNLEGLYYMPYLYIQADMDWSPQEVADRMQVLRDADFIRYDDEAEVILLVSGLEFHQPKSPPQIKGARNALQSVPATTLWPDFLASAKINADALFEALGGDEELDKYRPRPKSLADPNDPDLPAIGEAA